jgi:ABC-2 type transport system ATP-binding protein
MIDTETAIKTSSLKKVFGDLTAVESLDLQVRKGELFGLVGPDGAGKTTIMRLLTAIMLPTSGEAWVAGRSIRSESEFIKENIGYMSQRFGLYEDLTVMENIDFYADLYMVSRKERAPRVDRLLGFSNLTPFKDRLAGNLSGGMKQKLGLACALIHTPEVLFLDEPTNGVDPVSRRDFWRILYDLLKERITIFVSTSYLDEAERCTRIGLINRGVLLTVDAPDNIRKLLTVPMVEISSPHARRALSVVADTEGVQSATIYGDRLHVALENLEVTKMILARLNAEGIEIGPVRQIEPSLEDVFISMVGDKPA